MKAAENMRMVLRGKPGMDSCMWESSAQSWSRLERGQRKERMKQLSQSRADMVADVSGGESQVRCCEEQYCIGT